MVKSPFAVCLFVQAPILAVKLFITVTVAVSFFRLLPVFKSCTLKLSKVVFPIEGYSGEGVNKILMPCSLSSHSWVALPNIYGLYVELVLVLSCFRVLLLTPEGACISLMLKSKSHIILSFATANFHLRSLKFLLLSSFCFLVSFRNYDCKGSCKMMVLK